MAAELKPYKAYKDSGVEELGAIPAHWEVRHLGRFGRLFKGGGGTKEDVRESGVPCVRYGDLYTQHQFFITATRACVAPELAGTVYTPIRYGDVLFAGSGETIDEIGKSAVNLIPGPACCGGDVIILRPSIDADARFLGYAMDCAATARQKACIGRGFTVVHIYSSALKYVTVAMPPLPEQAAIVRFLDHADRRIRRYIRAKQKLIARLEEQKQAIIRQSVTGQVDVRTGQPYPYYKHTDAGWLEQVPMHWESRRLKWVTRLQRGYDLPSDRRVSGPFPVVSSGGVIDTHSESRSAGPGVVMGRYGSTNAVFYIEQDFWPHNTSLFVTDFQGNSSKWCYYLLSAITKADQAGKSAVPGLDRKDLFQIVVPVPPIAEQRETVRAIETVTESLTAAISATEREISVMHEYEIRLVADIVTGKRDVRGVADGLPDVDFLADDDLEGMRDTDTGSESPPPSKQYTRMRSMTRSRAVLNVSCARH